MSDLHDAFKGKTIIGIDLGTTNSGVSVWNEEAGRAVMLPDADGYNLTPSIVGWDRKQNRFLVGRAARSLSKEDPTRVAYSIKRFIGRWFRDDAVQYRGELSYHLESGGSNGQLEDVVVNFGTDKEGQSVRLTAPQVSAKILAHLHNVAAERLGRARDEVQYAVVTVPAYFNAIQRKATILAGQQAELTVVDILNEPTAAALAYRDVILADAETDEFGGKERRILIYDLGGGTFDISLLEVSSTDWGYAFYTKVVDGDTHLGGDDIDLAIMRWLERQIEEQTGHKVRGDDLITRERLRAAAEAAKIALSNQESYQIDLPDLALSSRAPFDLTLTMSRAEVEACASDLIQRTEMIARRAVQDAARYTWDEIDEVLLVGGMTLMPAIQRSVERLSGKPPRLIDKPQDAVALGAGEYGRILSLGKEKFHQNSLVNVVALPLGIHLPEEDHSFRALVEANSQVPFRSKPYYITTTEDNQAKIDVEILQGKRRGVTTAEECVSLGTLSMEILPAPARTPKFAVEFDVQSSGTVKVMVSNTRSNEPPKEYDIVEKNVSFYVEEAAVRNPEEATHGRT